MTFDSFWFEIGQKKPNTGWKKIVSLNRSGISQLLKEESTYRINNIKILTTIDGLLNILIFSKILIHDYSTQIDMANVMLPIFQLQKYYLLNHVKLIHLDRAYSQSTDCTNDDVIVHKNDLTVEELIQTRL